MAAGAAGLHDVASSPHGPCPSCATRPSLPPHDAAHAARLPIQGACAPPASASLTTCWCPSPPLTGLTDLLDMPRPERPARPPLQMPAVRAPHLRLPSYGLQGPACPSPAPDMLSLPPTCRVAHPRCLARWQLQSAGTRLVRKGSKVAKAASTLSALRPLARPPRHAG